MVVHSAPPGKLKESLAGVGQGIGRCIFCHYQFIFHHTGSLVHHHSVDHLAYD